MRDLDWFDGPEHDADGDRRRAPRRWLLPLLAVPWLVVVALLVLPRTEGSGTAAPPEDETSTVVLAGPAEATTDPDETEPTATGPPSSGPPTADDPPALPGSATVLQLEELRGRWRVGPGSEEAAALAIAIARSWLTGLGPRLALPGATPEPDTYAEHLVVEAVEQPSERTSVVTVLAIVLTEPEDQEMTVDVRRLAVPLATDQGAPRPAGAPWLLPGPTLTPAAVDLVPMDDPEAVDAATTALAVAGLGDLEVRALASAEGWPVVATATDGSRDQTIWLRPHLDGFVVAGSTVAGSTVADSTVADSTLTGDDGEAER
jgi:hypothetical protein